MPKTITFCLISLITISLFTGCSDYNGYGSYGYSGMFLDDDPGMGRYFSEEIRRLDEAQMRYEIRSLRNELNNLRFGNIVSEGIYFIP